MARVAHTVCAESFVPGSRPPGQNTNTPYSPGSEPRSFRGCRSAETAQATSTVPRRALRDGFDSRVHLSCSTCAPPDPSCATRRLRAQTPRQNSRSAPWPHKSIKRVSLYPRTIVSSCMHACVKQCGGQTSVARSETSHNNSQRTLLSRARRARCVDESPPIHRHRLTMRSVVQCFSKANRDPIRAKRLEN